MNYEQFRDLTRRMREAQRGFFKSKQGSSERNQFLIDSKKLEKEVDQELKGTNQASIFSEQGGVHE